MWATAGWCRARKSGKDRLVPLIYGQDSATYVIVGANGASPTHPEWVLNLAADPNVATLARIYPTYDAMKGMTSRPIPVEQSLLNEGTPVPLLTRDAARPSGDDGPQATDDRTAPVVDACGVDPCASPVSPSGDGRSI